MARTIDVNAGKETCHGLVGSTGHIRDRVQWDRPRNRGASWYNDVGEISGISKTSLRDDDEQSSFEQYSRGCVNCTHCEYTIWNGIIHVIELDTADCGGGLPVRLLRW